MAKSPAKEASIRQLNRSSDIYYGVLCRKLAPSLISTAFQFRDLFSAEGSTRQAVKEYFRAVGQARYWPKPRLRLADAYRSLGWDAFAMAEYLKVLRLTKTGPEAKAALAALRDYSTKHPEGPFNYALGLFFLERYEEGFQQMTTFLRNNPVNVRAPKAYEILQHLQAGDRVFVKRFLRDEVFL
ncbi:MAG: hypothetical protein D6679_09345 [Candidatus Hydrogenedentota bacterium]|nr:MAG: hypothetical protein D6679_09345 [Candidatus Hydrogenedentota bacterium]